MGNWGEITLLRRVITPFISGYKPTLYNTKVLVKGLFGIPIIVLSFIDCAGGYERF